MYFLVAFKPFDDLLKPVQVALVGVVLIWDPEGVNVKEPVISCLNGQLTQPVFHHDGIFVGASTPLGHDPLEESVVSHQVAFALHMHDSLDQHHLLADLLL